jgi:hypothetical protein
MGMPETKWNAHSIRSGSPDFDKQGWGRRMMSYDAAGTTVNTEVLGAIATGSDALEAVGEIAFGALKKNDRILIKTNNNTYRFSVVDAALRQGVLVGGSLGETPRRAVLVVSVTQEDSGEVSETCGLKTGARAVFYLVSFDGMERLITSAVSSLRLVRNDNQTRPVS